MLYLWSAEYVVAHAKRQKSRGKMPSLSYRGISNPKKALALALVMIQDAQFKDSVIKTVDKDSFTKEDGWTFGFSNEWGVTPKPGDIARFYGRGIGSTVRGLDINGVECFYRTEEQQRAENAQQIAKSIAEQKATFEKNKSALNKKFKNLPEIFQWRVKRFRKNNSDFRWKFESYEIFCCEQAVVIAEWTEKELAKEAAKKTLSLYIFKKVYPGKAITLLDEFYELPWEKQHKKIRKLSDGHSGNTFGCAMVLAKMFLSEKPENIANMHGALAPLVGSAEYGCIPRE